MTILKHRIYLGFYVISAFVVLFLLVWFGYDYYSTPIVDRFNHPAYSNLRPSGTFGHLYGILGTFMILLGISLYMLRKRWRFMARFGILKHWLEFHIWLCTVGAILILFHTSFKFGGIVSISFWSMIAVVLSGIIGRYIYLQIPRTIEGRALSLNEIQKLKIDFENQLYQHYQIEFTINLKETLSIKSFKEHLNKNEISRSELQKAVKIYKSFHALESRIKRLELMQNLFRYWHVIHLPVALIMLIIMVIHVVIALLFGYLWIF